MDRKYLRGFPHSWGTCYTAGAAELREVTFQSPGDRGLRDRPVLLWKSVFPAIGKAEGEMPVEGMSGLQSEFEISPSNLVRP